MGATRPHNNRPDGYREPAICRDDDWESTRVSLNAAFTVFGKRWNGMILVVLARGATRFADIRRRLPGAISDSVLSSRLKKLGARGLVSREVIVGPPAAVGYFLTENGRALLPALESLDRWARTYL